ncbi:hypothetical protein [Massilia endophytica]|uniref:hypothetical protein n=1 Tax=Massilia endophytica TaxID=2899220 RepID=UPI001E3C0DDD|nr:hypothetical protein [Massilia endophytica]UGQ48903.1 hypothetical protein LSQ66_10695 [Massilia endophytica]
MKPSTRAALFSALLFPGLGQLLVLKRTLRACLFLLPAAAAFLWLLRSALQTAESIAGQIASGALPLDIQIISERIAAAGGDALAPQIAGAVLLAAWIGSILDALLSRPPEQA